MGNPLSPPKCRRNPFWLTKMFAEPLLYENSASNSTVLYLLGSFFLQQNTVPSQQVKLIINPFRTHTMFK
jgi:hypothetical protein